jgi:hypothetical protein
MQVIKVLPEGILFPEDMNFKATQMVVLYARAVDWVKEEKQTEEGLLIVPFGDDYTTIFGDKKVTQKLIKRAAFEFGRQGVEVQII